MDYDMHNKDRNTDRDLARRIHNVIHALALDVELAVLLHARTYVLSITPITILGS